MIRRIYIDNFRCFSNFEFTPERVNLILGANGSGKTSLFHVITVLLRLVRSGHEVDALFPRSCLTKWDQRDEQRFELGVSINGHDYQYLLRVKHPNHTERAEILEEQIVLGTTTLFRYADGLVHLHRNDGSTGTSFPFRPSRSFLAEMQLRPENTSLFELLDFLDATRVVKLVPSSMRSTTEIEIPTLASDGSNFASWYRHFVQENAGALHELFSELKPIIPGFDSLTLIGAGSQGRTRDLGVKFTGVAGPAYVVDFQDLSDGQRVLILLYTLLQDLKRKSGLLLLDEPENYLALTEIQPWLMAMGEALGDNGQVITVSHNPEAIDHLAPEHPFWFERLAGGPVRVSQAVFERDTGAKASEQLLLGAFDAD